MAVTYSELLTYLLTHLLTYLLTRRPNLAAALRAHLGRADPNEGAQRHYRGERASMVLRSTVQPTRPLAAG